MAPAKHTKTPDEVAAEFIEDVRRSRTRGGTPMAHLYTAEELKESWGKRSSNSVADSLDDGTHLDREPDEAIRQLKPADDSPPARLEQVEEFKGRDPAALLFHYKAHRTIARMHASQATVKLLWGPYGSGKTTGCIAELINLSRTRVPAMKDGVRRSRWAVIRASKPNLWRATVPAFLHFLPLELFGTFNKADLQVHYRFNDGYGDIEIDIDFIGLDRPEDAQKLRSTEFTGAYINEASEVREEIFLHLRTRVGRYPSRNQVPPTAKSVPGIIVMDTNPTDVDSWIHKIFFSLDKPPFFELFRQPGGLHPDAENLEFLPGGREYYTTQMEGAPEDWLKAFRDAEPSYISVGTAIFPQFRPQLHAAKPLHCSRATGIVVGMDFGRSPAAVFLQRDGFGRWSALEEIVTEDCSVLEFAGMLMPTIRRLNPDCKEVEFYGDPAGMAESQTRDENCFDILAGEGIDASPTDTNSPAIRFEAVRRVLKQLDDTGSPHLMVDPDGCPTLVRALSGAYQYKDNEYKAAKNRFSHVAEALQYGLLGAGEDIELTTSKGDFPNSAAQNRHVSPKPWGTNYPSNSRQPRPTHSQRRGWGGLQRRGGY